VYIHIYAYIRVCVCLRLLIRGGSCLPETCMFRTPAITHAQTGEWSGTGSAESVERSATSNSDTSNDICADVLKHDDIFLARFVIKCPKNILRQKLQLEKMLPLCILLLLPAASAFAFSAGNTPVHTYRYLCIFLHICLHVCIVCTYVYMHGVCMYVCVYGYVCMYECACACVCVCACVCDASTACDQ